MDPLRLPLPDLDQFSRNGLAKTLGASTYEDMLIFKVDGLGGEPFELGTVVFGVECCGC